MANISAATTITERVLVSGDNSFTFNAAEAISKGAAVELDPGAGDMYVKPADSADAAPCIGVADDTYTSTDTDVLVHMYGCVCNVMNNDDTTAIEAGSLVKATTNSNAIDGAVAAVTPGGATEYILGTALEDIGGGSFGKVLIHPHVNIIA